MTKFKKPLTLALTAFGLISLAGCGGIQSKDSLILEYTYTTPSGETQTKNITADDVYQRYLKQNPKDHAKAYYDAINEITIRFSFENENGKMHEFLADMNKEADLAVKGAKDDADSAGTDWDTYLTNQGYKDTNMSTDEKEHQLWLDSQLKEMKAKVDDEYYETFKVWDSSKIDEADKKEQNEFNLVWGDNGYLKTKLPYHIKHILVKIGGSSDNFITSTVEESQATKLSRVIDRLVSMDPENNSFGQIANIESDDSGSNKNFGEYLMDTDEGFVNEFKLAFYTYDMLFNNETYETYKKLNNADAFNMPGYTPEGNYDEDSAAGYLNNLGVSFIPYGAVKELEKYASTTTTTDGKTVNEGETSYYPRNVIFNKYFNRHNIAFITDKDVKVPELSAITSTNPENPYKINYSDGNTGYTDLINDGKYESSSSAYTGIDERNFKEVTFANGEKQKVLCDEHDNPIMVALNATSSGGIHLMVVERSPLVENAKENVLDEKKARNVSLPEYYAPVNPLERDGINTSTGRKYFNSDYPGVNNTEGSYSDPKLSYVYSRTEKTTYEYGQTVESLETKLTSYQSDSKEFLVNQWLQGDNKLQPKDETVKKLVSSYEEQTILSVQNKTADTLKDAWDSYITTIKQQENSRQKGLILETCALHFGEDDYYKKGGICYYSNSKDQTGGSETTPEGTK